MLLNQILHQIQYRKTWLVTILFATALTVALLLGNYRVFSSACAQTIPDEPQVELTNTSANGGGVTIHRYSAPPHDQVNSYWIETNEGVVIVDAQRFLSQARYLTEEIRAITNKPILGIFITHHHTDHIGGLPALVEAFGPNVPIYAPHSLSVMILKLMDMVTWPDEKSFMAMTFQPLRTYRCQTRLSRIATQSS